MTLGISETYPLEGSLYATKQSLEETLSEVESRLSSCLSSTY